MVGRQVQMPFIRHSSPQSYPLGHNRLSGLPSGIGTFSRLRGMPMRRASPVRVSMLTTIIESVRTPIRSRPASEPNSAMLTRGMSAQGSGSSGSAVCPSPKPSEKTSRTRSAWTVE